MEVDAETKTDAETTKVAVVVEEPAEEAKEDKTESTGKQLDFLFFCLF